MDVPAGAVTNTFICQSHWSALELGGYGGHQAQRQAILQELLKIHYNMGELDKFSFRFNINKERLELWIRSLWSRLYPHIPRTVNPELARKRLWDLYLAYKRSWTRLGVNIVPAGTPYRSPADAEADEAAAQAAPAIQAQVEAGAAPGPPPHLGLLLYLYLS
ncbi:hypothetical protein N7481_005933 [Penicillium waksmanii]|uniref:uncharacterized protein n=1 Tax=Penicillium waksmanii TaxID=69791 RepID=UPI002547FE6A|nr:uncharacterized protein N7481_005933 [Penicillium waksmanii]KAJ5983834.1 hypothetical protein N7481_005933 [Penicillium waksmanii]